MNSDNTAVCRSSLLDCDGTDCEYFCYSTVEYCDFLNIFSPWCFYFAAQADCEYRRDLAAFHAKLDMAMNNTTQQQPTMDSQKVGC